MELLLTREPSANGATIGRLDVEGKFECWTLEDVVRVGEKVPGETAIPAGRYQIRLTFSPRFKRVLPLLLDVPGFEGVRVHAGNTADDTEGCILVGRSRGDAAVYQSRVAFDILFGKLEAARRVDEDVWITIVAG